jgi:hypothetical protein
MDTELELASALELDEELDDEPGTELNLILLLLAGVAVDSSFFSSSISEPDWSDSAGTLLNVSLARSTGFESLVP